MSSAVGWSHFARAWVDASIGTASGTCYPPARLSTSPCRLAVLTARSHLWLGRIRRHKEQKVLGINWQVVLPGRWAKTWKWTNHSRSAGQQLHLTGGVVDIAVRRTNRSILRGTTNARRAENGVGVNFTCTLFNCFRSFFESHIKQLTCYNRLDTIRGWQWYCHRIPYELEWPHWHRHGTPALVTCNWGE